MDGKAVVVVMEGGKLRIRGEEGFYSRSCIGGSANVIFMKANEPSYFDLRDRPHGSQILPSHLPCRSLAGGLCKSSRW